MTRSIFISFGIEIALFFVFMNFVAAAAEEKSVYPWAVGEKIRYKLKDADGEYSEECVLKKIKHKKDQDLYQFEIEGSLQSESNKISLIIDDKGRFQKCWGMMMMEGFDGMLRISASFEDGKLKCSGQFSAGPDQFKTNPQEVSIPEGTWVFLPSVTWLGLYLSLLPLEPDYVKAFPGILIAPGAQSGSNTKTFLAAPNCKISVLKEDTMTFHGKPAQVFWIKLEVPSSWFSDKPKSGKGISVFDIYISKDTRKLLKLESKQENMMADLVE